MAFRFSAAIYKVGINACVDVPERVTAKMTAVRGYIPVKGFIGKYAFTQTLVPVKERPHRLYVNGPMLKGSSVSVGQLATFVIAQVPPGKKRAEPVPALLKQELAKGKLTAKFFQLVPSRQKEILKYLNHLKTPGAMKRNVDRIVRNLKERN
jgi:hypothetical protein